MFCPVSVVIPAYNAGGNIAALVKSVIAQDSFAGEDELIVVDDCSKDGSAEIAETNGARVIRMEKNAGPSAARNRGVKEAKNDLIVFLDSDTVLEPGALSAIKAFFAANPDATCVNGMCSENPLVSSPARNYKALVERTWHENILRKRVPIYCFNTRIGAIRKKAFIEAGWFDEEYREPIVEDYEFSYRLLAKQAIHIDPKIRVRHIFPDFRGTVKDYWSRSGRWVELFIDRRKFDTGGTSTANAFGHVVGVLLPLAAVLSFWQSWLLLMAALLAIMFFWIYRDFFLLVVRRKGLWALCQAIWFHIIYSVVIVASATVGAVRVIWRRLSGGAGASA